MLWLFDCRWRSRRTSFVSLQRSPGEKAGMEVQGWLTRPRTHTKTGDSMSSFCVRLRHRQSSALSLSVCACLLFACGGQVEIGEYGYDVSSMRATCLLSPPPPPSLSLSLSLSALRLSPSLCARVRVCARVCRGTATKHKRQRLSHRIDFTFAQRNHP